MAKCFITRLKGSVTNDTLSILGAIRVNVIGEENLANKISGNLTFSGSKCNWKGTSGCTLPSYPDYELNRYNVVTTKEAKGLLLLTDKYSLKEIDISYGYGACVKLSDLNYCKNLYNLAISNSYQEGDLSEISDLNLKGLNIAKSKITGSLDSLSKMTSLNSLNIRETSISGDIANLAGNKNMSTVDISNSHVYGSLSSLIGCSKIKNILSMDNSVLEGNLEDFANHANLIAFQNLALNNTWSSESLRPSNMPKIVITSKFKTATDTDNFLKNMAKCSDEGVIGKTFFFGNSHRTSASDAAVSTLQNAGYTLSQLITD